MPRIPDPKMNPSGERAYGIVSDEDNGHYDIYIKEDYGLPQDSRYLPTGSKVRIGDIWPAFLVTFKNKKELLDDYENAKYKNGNIHGGIKNIDRLINAFNELNEILEESDFELVTKKWDKEANETPVIVDFTDEIELHPDASNEVVKEQIRNRTFEYFRTQ